MENEPITPETQPEESPDVEQPDVEQPVNPEITEATPEPTPAEANELSAEVQALIAEAEQRGYLRGRNDAAQQWLNSNLYDNPLRQPAPQEAADPLADAFLSAIPPGVWD